MALQLVGDLHGEGAPRVVHRAHQRLDLDGRVQVLLHLAQRPHQVGESLERVVLALHRDDHGVGRGEAVHGEHVERRRAVDEHVVVVVEHGGERFAQTVLAAIDRDELDLGAGERAVGADDVVAASARHARLAMPYSPRTTP